MPEHKKGIRKKSPLPQKIKRKAITFRLIEDDIRKLGVAAYRAGLNKTVYVQLALRAQFEKDHVE